MSHREDQGIAGALAAWTGLSAASHLRPIVHVEYARSSGLGSQPLDLGRRTQVLNGGDWSSEALMYTLHGAGELDRIDIVSVATGVLSIEQQGDLAEADAMLRSDLRRIAPADTGVFLQRVWVPDYGDERLSPPAAFINAETDGAFVVLPTDRQFERSMAMPVSSSESGDAHAWHVAVEIASLAGLWSTMVGSPLEFVEYAPGGLGKPLVRLVRSTCRAARIRAPSPEHTLESDGVLPLPPGLLPAPDPSHIVRAAPPLIYPDEFRVPDEDDPDDDAAHDTLGAIGDGATARRLAIETVGGALNRYDDIGAAAQQLNEFALDTARIAPWTAPIVGEDGLGADSDDALDDAYWLLEEMRPPVSLEGVPTSGWDKMLRRVLGVVDASMLDDGVRAAVGSERYVVLDPAALAPADGDLLDVLAALDPSAHAVSSLHDDPDSGAFDKGVPARPMTTDADSAARDDADDVSATGDSVNEHVEATDNDGMPARRSGSGGRGMKRRWRQRRTAQQADLVADSTLLTGVTGRFDIEIERCDDRIDSLFEELRDHLRRESRPEPGVTAFVALASLTAVLIGAGALLTLTGLREVFTPDHLSDSVRVATFGLLSILVTVPPVLRLTPSRSLSAQVRLTLLAAVYTAVAATLLVLAKPVSQSFLDEPGHWFPAMAVIAGVVALTLLGRLREFSGDQSLMGPLAPLVSNSAVSVATLSYMFVMAVAALNYEATAPQIFEDRNWRLLTVLLATAVAVAAVTGGLVRLIRRRDRRQVRAWKSGLDALVDQLELTTARKSLLATLKVHWLASASVVTRLIHRPFGVEIRHMDVQDPDSPVRKLLILDLDLTDDTRDDYLAELLPLVAPRGWMGEQYRRMAKRFTEAERARYGISAERDTPPPEHCTYPIALEAARSGEGIGPRWKFARSVYDGAYDGLLRHAADDALAQAMRATFVNERVAVKLDHESGEEAMLPALLGELLPSGETRLPTGSLPPRPEAPPEYTPYVWWPAEVSTPAANVPPDQTCGYLRDRGTLLFHAIRVDISEPVEVDRLLPIPGPPRNAERLETDVADHVSSVAEPLM
ncbi:hypothetical protein [Candidatus Poriferisodalis sp.]|uniref:hypothetical protein n=1 Tax=Candidatus Poriferisodalis sp. TaxID=3101277 RepID=UPI003D0F00BE